MFLPSKIAAIVALAIPILAKPMKQRLYQKRKAGA
jgi:hypothetical protein